LLSRVVVVIWNADKNASIGELMGNFVVVFVKQQIHLFICILKQVVKVI